MPASDLPSTELDAELRALASGDRRALDRCFDALWPKLLRYCVRWLGSGAEAEDAAQSTLERVVRRAREYDGERSGLGWVLGLAAWECRTRRTRERRSRELTHPAPDQASGSSSPETEAMNAEAVRFAMECFEQLSTADQAALAATLDDAREPGRARSAALRKRTQRAFERLRRMLRGEFL